jgi:predicted enzyme related to lactoylglutathione lyase
MNVRRVVPDLHTDRIDESREFYSDVLGMHATMDMGWTVILTSAADHTAQISLTSHDLTAPVASEVTIEVADVEVAYARANRRGARIVHPLTDESWGVRRFLVEDPDGHVICVMEPVRE